AQPDAWMNCLQEFVRSDGIYRCPLDPHFGKPDQLEGRYGACTHERTSYAAARLRSEEVRPDGTVRIPLPGDESAVLLTDSVLINREAEAAPYATSHGQEVIQAYRDGHVKIGSLGRP
ncbi:MAG: hypothetical protein SFX74_11155, partial [Fimbriimonadaceae bacterium]|nr:hypothetical protein [Fimbriimonadaceae bacterium]